MDTSQIQLAISKFKFLSTNYKGTFSIDTLPNNLPPFSSIITNLSASHLPGSHWIAIFINSNKEAEVFDPLALSMSFPLRLWLSKFKKFHVNKIRVQSFVSTACGQFCIYFLLLRSLGLSMSKIVDHLKSQQNPDKFVIKKIKA